MMTADPRFVKNVRQISHITYREAMELSHFGAKVIYPPTIQPVMAKGIPVSLKILLRRMTKAHSSNPIQRAEKEMIRGITSIDHITVLNLEGSGMVGIPGFSKRLFDALSRSRDQRHSHYAKLIGTFDLRRHRGKVRRKSKTSGRSRIRIRDQRRHDRSAKGRERFLDPRPCRRQDEGTHRR